MKIALVGYGTMNQLVASEIKKNNDEVCGIVSLGYLESLYDINDTIDCIIDFSHPSLLDTVLDFAVKEHKPLVIATTGYSDEQKEKIYAASKKIPLVYTANFSLGITVLKRVLGEVSEILKNDYDMEIIEKHHNKKVDAPSGTAKLLLDAIDPNNEFDHVYGREGQSKRGHEIGIHAIRGGSIVGEHSVIFAGCDEVIEFKHKAHSKMIFVKGALKAASFVVNANDGLYTMEDILFKK